MFAPCRAGCTRRVRVASELQPTLRTEFTPRMRNMLWSVSNNGFWNRSHKNHAVDHSSAKEPRTRKISKRTAFLTSSHCHNFHQEATTALGVCSTRSRKDLMRLIEHKHTYQISLLCVLRPDGSELIDHARFRVQLTSSTIVTSFSASFCFSSLFTATCFFTCTRFSKPSRHCSFVSASVHGSCRYIFVSTRNRLQQNTF